MYIHRAGRKIIANHSLLSLLGIIALILFPCPCTPLLPYIAIPLLLSLLVCVILFFRIPKREHVKDKQAILAPADGKVVFVGRDVEQEDFKEERIRISIFMSLTNVHQNLSPVKGEVRLVRHTKGKFLPAFRPKSSLLNERTTTHIRMENGTSIVVRQIAGAMARRIENYLEVGKTIDQGDELGFIKFGSRVDVFIPVDNAVCLIKKGDRTQGGITKLALWNDETTS